MKQPSESPLALYEKGDVRGAERRCNAILQKRPRDAESLNVLGCIRMRRSNPEGAVKLIQRAVSAAPREARYHENLAEAQYRSGRPESAEAECRLALRIKKQQPRSLHLLGKIYLDRSDYSRALEYLPAAVAAQPDNKDALLDLSVALNRTGNHELAANYSKLVLKLISNYPPAYVNLGMAYKGMNRLEEARQAFANAGNFPPARYNLGYVRLLEDDLASGLPLLEARKEILGIGKGLRKPEWNGERRLGDSLLVIHEQGFGDTILMSRFYPMLLDNFKRVIVCVQKPLARLIATVCPQIEVVTNLENVKYGAWCANGSLPLLLGIDRVDQIPTEPWLHVPRPVAANDRLRVGLNWAGNPSYAYDAIRSTTLTELKMFFQVREVEWVSLHKGHREHEAEAFGLPQPLKDARDFYDTAEVISGLDLVISTETVTPNLSGALGIPTCVLAGTITDWRWKSWYPNVRVCRQQASGNWFGPIASALEAIQHELASATPAA